MAFDLAKKVSTFVANHIFGESIDYRAWPAPTWATIRAVVDRHPIDEVGQFLRNTAIVTVSKDAVAGWSITKDEIILTEDQRPHEQPPSYTVMSVKDDAGQWILHCERKK